MNPKLTPGAVRISRCYAAACVPCGGWRQGVWIGVHWARRISQVLFYRFLYAGMLFTALKSVWDGLLA